MSELKFTPGPWLVEDERDGTFSVWTRQPHTGTLATVHDEDINGEYPAKANAKLIAAAPELIEALREGRRAIGDHYAPGDCYATGPLTGDDIRDLVECPACSFIAMYESVMAKATA